MDSQISKAIKEIKEGNVIIYPTESCYSFGCDPKNRKAVERMHKIKKEPLDKPVILLVSDLKQISEYGIINPIAKKLCGKFMPGQLNLIIEKKDNKKHAHLSKDGICFRIPDINLGFGWLAYKLCKEFGGAIPTSSVNLHSKLELYDIAKVKKYFNNKVEYIIDVGNLNKKISVSTIFDTRKKLVLREGLITKKQIISALK